VITQWSGRYVRAFTPVATATTITEKSKTEEQCTKVQPKERGDDWMAFSNCGDEQGTKD
jgi:hypothetical protein